MYPLHAGLENPRWAYCWTSLIWKTRMQWIGIERHLSAAAALPVCGLSVSLPKVPGIWTSAPAHLQASSADTRSDPERRPLSLGFPHGRGYPFQIVFWSQALA